MWPTGRFRQTPLPRFTGRTLRISWHPGGKVLPAEAALMSFPTRCPPSQGAPMPGPGLGVVPEPQLQGALLRPEEQGSPIRCT